MGKKYIGYGRSSRLNGREGDSFIAEDEQRKAVEAWAAAKGATVVDWLYEVDVSGKNEHRPKMLEAQRRVEAGEAEGIVAAKLDRLTRSLIYLGKLLEWAKEGKHNLVAIDFGLDFHTPNGKLVAQILGAIAEWELEIKAEGWLATKRNALDRGVYISRWIPTGYVKADDRSLAVDEAVAPHVLHVFRMRPAGASWQKMADYLNDHGVTTSRGKEWVPSSVRQLVMNRAYLGEARQGAIVNPDAHEPIVSLAEWKAAQPGKPVLLHNEERRSASAVLRGIVVCAGCGYRMLVGGAPESRPSYYYCVGKHGNGKCPARTTARHDRLDAYVLERILEAFEGDGPLAESARDEKGLRAAVAELEAAQSDLLTWATEGSLGLPAAVQRAGNEARQARVELAEMAVEDARALAGHGHHAGALLEELRAGSLTPPETRDVLAGYLDRVILRRAKFKQEPLADRVQIVLKGNVVLEHVTVQA